MWFSLFVVETYCLSALWLENVDFNLLKFNGGQKKNHQQMLGCKFMDRSLLLHHDMKSWQCHHQSVCLCV